MSEDAWSGRRASAGSGSIGSVEHGAAGDMGIYDRPYIDNRRPSGGGGGGLNRVSFRPSELSVTSWLIIINVAIFFLNGTLPLVDIPDARVIPSGIPQEVVDRAVPLDVDRPQGIPAGVAWRAPLIDQQTNQPLAVANPETGEPVGAAQIYRSWRPLNGYGHFSLLKGFQALEVWRVVTFQFLHADFLHLFFNMFGLFIFGGMVEQYLGRKKYLSYYLICGIAGSLLYLVFTALNALGVPLPGTLAMTSTGTPLIGASAGVFGVIVACARIAPDMRVMLLFPPIPLKMKWMAYGYVGIAAFNLITGGGNAGGDAAHLGGAIAGFYFIRNQHLLRGFLDFGIGPPAQRKAKPKAARPKPGQKSKDDAEVDRILAKVSVEGLQSLTAKEKRTLEQASRETRDRA
ncbi:MAG: rhomboid family intramembrane serine protease [Planctomycetota bacterium]